MLITGIIVFISLIAFLWVTGIAYMKDVHSEYQGEDFLEDPEKNIEKD